MDDNLTLSALTKIGQDGGPLDGTIYIGCDDYKLYAITPAGTVDWTYETGGKRVRLFVMDAGGTEQAGSVFTKWKASVEAQPMGGDELPHVFTCEQEYVGHILVAHEGRYLAGGIGDAADARPLLMQFLTRLGTQSP